METPREDNYRRLETLADNRAASVAVAAIAKRELVLFSHDLEPMLYDKEEFIAAVQALATRSRMSRIRVVTIDPGPAIRAGHRLVALAQRFSSYIEVRRASHDHAGLAETYLVADSTALLLRPVATRYEGYADLHAPFEARQQLKGFEEIWEKAEPDPEFRRLGI
ncbi:MAG TPA: acyltransferase [Gammaproteobacteria bacterium]